MNFHIITIFPKIFNSYFSESIIKRAQEKNKVKIKILNLRDFTKDKHKKVDDKSYGGGPGMVLMAEPIAKAVLDVLSDVNVVDDKKEKTVRTVRTTRTKVIVFSPTGKQFTQKMAQNWAKKYNNLILICGRYEGVDARVKKILRAEEISIGPYILTGGELPAAVVVDAVARHIPNVLGKEESLEEERGMSGFPVYTKPEVFEYQGKKHSAPKVLLSGHHEKIKNWREKHSKKFKF